jgi:NADPH-dependent 2,4-dienoyl-CoA reductase/sulfur reductase-like enzyme
LSITIEQVAKAMEALRANDIDVQDWDGMIYCYEWEAPQLIEAGIDPKHLVVVPTEMPNS